MKKNNIRSIRLSDELMELIDRQVGDTFTARLENLIIRCVWELPEREKEMVELERRIKQKRLELAGLTTKVYTLKCIIDSVSSSAVKLRQSIEEGLRETEP